MQRAIENTRECFEQWIEDYAESQGLKEYYGEVHQQVLQLTFFDLLTPSTGERRMIDTIHHYRPEWSGIQAHCRLRIRAHRGKDVVIASELADNPGMSITNAVGWLLPQVVEKYGLDIEDVCWIEHYAWPGEPERFDLVTLHNGSPNWQSLALEQVEVLAGVEL